jgi:hemoglobin/transferrin/lactoferrin receptor protein
MSKYFNVLLMLGASTFALSLSAPASAAPGEVKPHATPVEIVTVTAMRVAAPVKDVPVTVSVISAGQIRNNLVRDIKDLVRYEPGVAVRSSPARFTAALGSTGRDGDSGFNIRGLEGNRVLFIVDGVRLPDAFSFGAQAVGRGDYIDLDLLKSVEILRGPASALYGSDGVAGAVSFTTKDPSDLLQGRGWAAQGSASYASADNSFAEGIAAAGGNDQWQGLVAYTRRDGHELETHGTNNAANTDRTTADPQDIFSNALLGKLVYTPDDHNRTRLTLEHDDRDVRTDVLSAIAKPPLSSTSTLGLLAHDTDSLDRIGLDHLFTGGTGIVETAYFDVYYQAGNTEQFAAEDRNTAADRTRDNTFDNRVWGFGAELQSDWVTGALTHHFVYGGDVSFTHQTGIRGGTVPSAGDFFPTRAFPITDYTLAGAYVQDEISVWDGRLKLYPALRYDYYDLDPTADALLPPSLTPTPQSDSHVSPKFGAVFKITPQISAFANFADGFKAPAPVQVNNAFANPLQNYLSIPNPNLKPETSQTFEGGLRYNDEIWSVSAAGFTGNYSNFIDQVQLGGSFTPLDPGIFQYVNLSNVKISGVEAKAEAHLESGFGGIFALSYAQGDVKSGGVTTPLNSIQPLKFVAGVNYNDPDGVFGGQLIGTYSDGKDPSRIDQTPCAPATCFAPPSFATLDATAWWNVTENFTLRIGVFNLTDEKYWWWSDVQGLSSASVARDAYTQPGRNVSVSLTAHL